MGDADAEFLAFMSEVKAIEVQDDGKGSGEAGASAAKPKAPPPSKPPPPAGQPRNFIHMLFSFPVHRVGVI